MNISFTNPEFLWLLIALPLLIIVHLFVVRRMKARAWMFANFEAIERVTGPRDSMRNSRKISKNWFMLLMHLLIITSIVLTLAGPVMSIKRESSSKTFILAIDASSSMLADDYKENRLDAAKRAAVKFVDDVGKTRIGLVSFSGVAKVMVRPTLDSEKVKAAILNIHPMVSGGTDIGQAIITSVNLISPKEMPASIVLLTDGRSTVGIPPEDGVKYAKKRGIAVDTIGVATKKGGSYVRVDLISRIDEKSLVRIASETNGNYFRVENGSMMTESFEKIAKKSLREVPFNATGAFLLLAFILITFEWVFLNTKYRALP